jgi:methylenetetrahydrofolate--tRNA-(uracil-5-)-methyltransferase
MHLQVAHPSPDAPALSMPQIHVIGAGLAGSEAAWQIAEAGVDVRLSEMRPETPTPVHQSGHCAELVCSNSLGSSLPDRAAGVLQLELEKLGSMLLDEARNCAVPAGQALAVDREQFAKQVHQRIQAHPRIELVCEEVRVLPESGTCIVASGPLTSESLAQSLAAAAGNQNLSFFDAIAPVVTNDSIDHQVVFRASRWQAKEDDGVRGDYLNIPLEKEDYERLVDHLLNGEKHELKDFEAADPRANDFFERCLPVEILAARGREALRFGPLRPVGLFNPNTGKRPHAVVQMRTENREQSMWNLVGFQTNLTYGEQKALLRALPGMAEAEFVRLGSMHRNTFLCSPMILDPSLEWRGRPGLFVAGQLCGMEGYLGNIGSGLLAGRNALRRFLGQECEIMPPTTLLGALANHVARANSSNFQPMKAEFGILPPLPAAIRKNERRREHALRSERALADHLANHQLPTATTV